MTLEELRALAKPGSQLEIFVQGLDARLPWSDIQFSTNNMEYGDVYPLATFLYNTFGLDVLVHDWRIHEDSNHIRLFRYLPFMPDECHYLIDREIDNKYVDMIRRVYPEASLPLELYRQFSLSLQIRCLKYYALSGLILDDEYNRVDQYMETLERGDLHDWLLGLILALEVANRYYDATKVKIICDDLGLIYP